MLKYLAHASVPKIKFNLLINHYRTIFYYLAELTDRLDWTDWLAALSFLLACLMLPTGDIRAIGEMVNPTTRHEMLLVWACNFVF